MFNRVVSDYLKVLSDCTAQAIPESRTAVSTINRYEGQLNYCLQQKRNDKTRRVLEKAFDPEWAEGECDVPAAKIRQIADEYVAHACIGETIEIEGVEMPFRPVAVMLGKGVNNGWGGYQTCWARTLLASLVGALEVPGGTLGTAVKLNRPADNRLKTVRPTMTA